MRKQYVSYHEFLRNLEKIYLWAKEFDFKYVYGVPRGGLISAVMLSHALCIPLISHLSVVTKDELVLVVDEIVDSGTTFQYFKSSYANTSYKFACLYKRYSCKLEPDFVAEIVNHNKWLVFPWEVWHNEITNK